MIRINRDNSAVPDKLKNSGRSECDLLKAEYCSGTRDFSSKRFKSSIYGDSTVKNALKDAQFDKCAYCEAKVTHTGYGDVEHFRPKAGWIQTKGDKLNKPGYYWLAYEWDNLIFSCQICNQQYKKNLFPLNNPAQRATSHVDSIINEDTFLINPLTTSPEEHLQFHKHIINGKTDYGCHTISICGLDRPELDEDRKNEYEIVAGLIDVILSAEALNDRIVQKAKGNLKKRCKSSAKYSLMVKSAIAKSNISLES